MDLGPLQATLGVDASGLRTAEQQMRSFGTNAESTLGNVSGVAKATASHLAAMVGVTLSVAGAFTVLYKSVSGGVNAMEDFRLKTIMIGSGLTNLAKEGQGSFEKMFKQNTAYAKAMYEEIRKEDAKRFASAEDLMTGYNALVQKGYSVRLDEVDSLGVLVDKIKLATAGQSTTLQINQEIRGLMDGQKRAGSLIAFELADRIGPAWKEIVEKHRQAGTLLKFLADQWPGIAAAAKEIENTLEAQTTTLSGNLKYIGREGMQGIYFEIVKVLQDMNTYLRENGDIIANYIQRGWAGVKDLVDGILAVLRDINKIVSTIAEWTIKIVVQPIGDAAKWLVAGAGSQGDFGFGALTQEAPKPRKLSTPAQTEQLKRAGVSGFFPGPGGEAIPIYGEAKEAVTQTISKPHPPGVEKGGGGKGAEAEINRLNSLFDTLTKDIARLSEGKLAEIEANYVKTVEQIYKKTSDRAHTEAEVEILAKQRATRQMEKLQDEFDLKMAKGSGDSFTELKKQYDKDVEDYNGLAGAKEKIDAYYNRQRIMKQVEQATEILNLDKQHIDTLASLTPILGDQIRFKQRSLDIENDLAQLAITKLVAEKPYLSYLEDELRARQALTHEAKKYALERENWMRLGVEGGLKKGALDRSQASETRLATWTIESMNAAETYIGETGGQAFVDTIHGAKADFTKMFTDLGDSFIKQLWKMGTTKLFDTVWGAFLDKGPGKLGTDQNPLVVRIHGSVPFGTGKGAGEPDFVKRAEKTGFTLPGAGLKNEKYGAWGDDIKGLTTYDKMMGKMYKGQLKDMGGIQKLQERFIKDDIRDLNTYGQMQQEIIDQNQEMFNSEYLNQYQSDFSSMTTGITSIWGTAQGLMTAMGVQGEAARYGAMVTYGMQGISLITELAKGKILVDAANAAAAGYSSVMEALPWPINIPIAVAWGALAFAGTMAAGTIKSSAGGDYQVAQTGIRRVHEQETILPAWAAQGWRDIVNRETSGKGNGNTPIYITVNSSIHPKQEMKQSDYDRHAKMITKSLNRELGRHGKAILGKSHG